jgi:hypothetical protein
MIWNWEERGRSGVRMKRDATTTGRINMADGA